jgi:hypothetical protein
MIMSSNRGITDARASSVAAMIEMARQQQHPLRRAQILAEAQPHLGWALRAAIEECVDNGNTWAEIGTAVSMPRETVYRQYKADGPVVTARAVHSPKATGQLVTNPDAAEAIYAFQTEDGQWWGPYDALAEGQYVVAALPFDPDPRTQNRFARQVLRVRIGQREDVSPHATQVQLADGRPWRARVTNEIINLLFEDGQTPTRRAMRDLYYATSGNPRVNPAFQQVVNRAADAMTANDHTFFAAVQAVVAAAPDDRNLGGTAGPALRRLKAVVDEYKRWTRFGQTP